MEMGEMASMLSTMGSTDKSSSKKNKEKMDSSFTFASTVDTIKSLSVEQKRILGKAGGKMHVDEANGELWIEMKFPFANAKEFELIQESMNNNNTKDFGVLDKLLGGKSKGMDLEEGENENTKRGMPMGKTWYTLTDNSITRKTIPAPVEPKDEKEQTKDEKEEAMMKKMMAMMEMNMNFTLNLPKPAKKVDAKDAIVSDDKKQIKFKKKVSIDEASTAELFNCTIEF
jgi:hypothetical protein